MTQKEKDLLLQDLCARLSYGVKINIDDDFPIVLNQISYSDGYIGGNNECYSLEHFVIKPYLFPLSSMTEEQKIRISAIQDMGPSYYHLLVDRYNEWYIDYRGLIPKGLAIDATGLNIY